MFMEGVKSNVGDRAKRNFTYVKLFVITNDPYWGTPYFKHKALGRL